MFIESEKAKISWYNGCGGPQICDYDAEIAVNDNNEIIYINASDCSEGLMFSARRESIFDKLGTDAIVCFKIIVIFLNIFNLKFLF